jgi:membrane-associated phospholipid phosphatase
MTGPFSSATLRIWLVPLLGLAMMLFLAIPGSNQAVFMAINRSAGALPDTLWSCLTVIGDTLVALVIMLPFLRRRPELTGPLLLAAILGTLYVHGLKPLVEAARPAAVLPHEFLHVIGKTLRAGSFPSGHSTTAFTLAALLAAAFPSRALAFPVLAIACLAGISRVAVGAHWPLDVAAGAFGGWPCGMLSWRLLGHRTPPLLLVRIAQIVLLGCALFLLIGFDSGYPLARRFEQGVALLSLFAFVLARDRYRGK